MKYEKYKYINKKNNKKTDPSYLNKMDCHQAHTFECNVTVEV